MKRIVVAVLAAIALAAPGGARAADARYPDWPCNQVKVPELSVAAFWTGPSIASVGNAWEKDEKVHDLVLRLAARRTPLDDAEKTASKFIAGTPAEKTDKATMLFAGLFTTLSAERAQVMDGIERFAQRQHQLRDKLGSDLAALRQKQDVPKPDAAEIDKLGNQVAWDSRVFDERRHTIIYVCEVPGTIEQRLFALARAIQQSLD